MPLHDWTDDRGWDSVHRLWIGTLLYWLQDHLPGGYRAFLGSAPGLTIAAENGRPDLSVRHWENGTPAPAAGSALVEGATPDFHAVALLAPEPPSAVHVLYHGQLIAAIELVSPGNKDRPTAREFYRNRYLGYLWSGVHLLLVDVHRRPLQFSFAEAMAAELRCDIPVGPTPHAVSWSVGGPTPEGGRFLDGWARPLAVGEPLPVILLALTAERALAVDLERTYTEAARRAYLE